MKMFWRKKNDQPKENSLIKAEKNEVNNKKDDKAAIFAQNVISPFVFTSKGYCRNDQLYAQPLKYTTKNNFETLNNLANREYDQLLKMDRSLLSDLSFANKDILAAEIRQYILGSTFANFANVIDNSKLVYKTANDLPYLEPRLKKALTNAQNMINQDVVLGNIIYNVVCSLSYKTDAFEYFIEDEEKFQNSMKTDEQYCIIAANQTSEIIFMYVVSSINTEFDQIFYTVPMDDIAIMFAAVMDSNPDDIRTYIANIGDDRDIKTYLSMMIKNHFNDILGFGIEAILRDVNNLYCSRKAIHYEIFDHLKSIKSIEQKSDKIEQSDLF